MVVSGRMLRVTVAFTFTDSATKSQHPSIDIHGTVGQVRDVEHGAW